MSDLEARLAQLVKAEQQVAPPSDAVIDAGWARLARSLVGPLPPGPPDGETGGGAPGGGDPSADHDVRAGGHSPSTLGGSPRPRVADPNSSPSPAVPHHVVPLHPRPSPARVGVWVWPAAAIVAVAVVAAWRPWATSETPPSDHDTVMVTAPDASNRSTVAPRRDTSVATDVQAQRLATDPTIASQASRAAPTTPTVEAPPSETVPSRDPATKQTRRANTNASTHDEPTARPGLAEELALVDAMRSSFARDDPSEVLTLGKQHRKIFPKGALREERAALEVRASCRLGRADAGARRDAFLESWPTSAHVERIDRDCVSK